VNVRFPLLIALLASSLATKSVSASDLEPAVQARVTAAIQQAQAWAADPVIVQAVKVHNSSPPPEHAQVTQEKWKSLTILDPFVRGFSRNAAGELLKARKTPAVGEAFLSDAKGMKVAFLSKPSNWSHLGKAKHDDPMAGKVWQGPIEVDESSGLQQVQIAVPVLENGQPIGSLVVGLSLSKLMRD
jgi:hypothetical protein